MTSPSSENVAPSSPSSRAIFSDEPTRASSPPSSPPCFPWELQKDPSNGKRTSPIQGSNAFTVLGKRKALDSISDNVRPAKQRPSTATPPPSSTATTKPLTQMRISLGQEVQRKCKICGMEYVPSLPEDRALHDKYHKQNTEGYGLGKDFVSKARPRSVYYGAVPGDWVCAVDCYDKPPRKKRAQEVLEIVQRELGAVEIPEDGVWGRREGEGWKYRAYLYVREAKCIGFLLVQRIHEAYLVEQPVLLPDDIAKKINENAGGKTRALTALAALKERREAAADRERLLAKEPLKLSRSTHPASLGISRVWTSAPYRKQSIATKLLDTAMEHQHDVDHCSREKKRALEARFVHGTLDELKHITASTPKGPSICGKEDVAFSQPTEAGTRLARKWFGNLWGWSVYVD